MIQSQTPTRLAPIDGVRALACMMIFAYHSWQFAGSPQAWPLKWLADFPAGVDLFMVLSGFCLFYPLANSSSRLKNFRALDYAKRRVRRIVPAYYAAIVYAVVLPQALVFVYWVAHRPARLQRWPSPGDLTSHLTFTHTFWTSYWDGINGSFWSLGLEAQFYLLFPLLVLLSRRSPATAASFAIAVSVGYRVLVDLRVGHDNFPRDFLWTITGPGRWMQFGAGMIAAVTVSRGAVRGRGAVFALAAVGCYALGTGVDGAQAHLPVRDGLLALSFALLLVAACRPGVVSRSLGHPSVAFLGTFSYSVFLIHQPTIYYFQQGLERIGGVHGSTATLAILWTFGLALVVTISYGFFVLFEQPFLAPRRLEENAAP